LIALGRRPDVLRGDRLEEFMRPLALSQNKLARDLDVPIARINAIIHPTRAITADTALRLAAYLDTTPQF
jgi:antitoxin HigA-1